MCHLMLISCCFLQNASSSSIKGNLFIPDPSWLKLDDPKSGTFTKSAVDVSVHDGYRKNVTTSMNKISHDGKNIHIGAKKYLDLFEDHNWSMVQVENLLTFNKKLTKSFRVSLRESFVVSRTEASYNHCVSDFFRVSIGKGGNYVAENDLWSALAYLEKFTVRPCPPS